MTEPARNAVLILGPTASGKSALALRLAAERGGIIVNADSMQVYEGLRVLTARPDEAALAAAPHALYGHVDPAQTYSTGAWLSDVAALFASDARPKIIVGGTGLYFRALLGGLNAMPAVPQPIRDAWRRRLAEEGAPALHQRLAEADPAAAAAIGPNDGQRIVRALEVAEATGKPLSAWQTGAGEGLVDPASAERLLVLPDRATVVERIHRRLDAMVAEGALDEVAALLARGLDPSVPVMKAIGVREFAAALAGEVTLAAATEQAKAATRRYAKRQATWLRHQLGPGWRLAKT